jgi:hypothetical protein
VTRGRAPRGAPAVPLLAGLTIAMLTVLTPVPRALAQRAAQPPAAVTPELRLDGALGREGGAFGSLGAFVDAGLYTRLGLVVGVGATRGPAADRARTSPTFAPAARFEAIARFHVDPQRLSRRGLYAGGGVALSLREALAPRYGLVALLGLEGAPRGSVAPAVELGLGGGVRAGVALRRARRERR